MIEQAIAALAANNSAGAVEIAEQAADLLMRRARMGEAPTAEAFRQEIRHTSWALIRAQPTMAPLVNLVNAVLWKIEPADTPRVLRDAMITATQEFKRLLRVHEVAIAEWSLRLISDGAQVLTLGRSTTVGAALRHAQRAGRRFRVICAEGRPGLEGRLMAQELAEQSIPVSLVVDALATTLVEQSSIVLVGADHVSAQGLVNKTGTYALALAAKAARIHFYPLCSSAKFLPSGYVPPPQAVWPTTQIWEAPAPGVTIMNYYFDSTPLDKITGIVTEQGVLPTAGIEAWLAAIKLHPDLAAGMVENGRAIER